MKRGFPCSVFTVAVLAITALSASGQTNTVVIPQEAGNSFGSSWTYGFAYGEPYAEQIYAPTEFSTIEPLEKVAIAEVAFRLDERYSEGRDIVFRRIVLRMNAFPGTMEDIVSRLSGVEDPITVFDQENVQFSARAGFIDAFDVRFRLKSPFVYDRQVGPLVVSFEAGRGPDLDAQAVPLTGSVPERGGFILVEFGGIKRIRPVIAVTQFTYLTVWAKLGKMRRVNDHIEINLLTGGKASGVFLESSSAPEGPYAAAQSVIPASDGSAVVVVPVSDNVRFFRIRLQ